MGELQAILQQCLLLLLYYFSMALFLEKVCLIEECFVFAIDDPEKLVIGGTQYCFAFMGIVCQLFRHQRFGQQAGVGIQQIVVPQRDLAKSYASTVC